jgi:hypothetical protein
MKRVTPAKRRGFAMLTAVALVALVAMALAAVLALVRLDLGRTADALDEAQLRQMLLAGEHAARERLDAAGEAAPRTDEAVPISLPPALAADGGAVDVTVLPRASRAAAEVVEVTVRARLGEKAASQTLRYERTSRGWRATAAALTVPGGG